MQRGQPLFARFSELPICHDEPRRQEGLRASALIPLCHEGRVIGAVGLGSHRNGELPPPTRLGLEALAAQASGAIARIRSEAHRSRLERQLLEISDREQARIGHEIHDGLCQHLVSLAFDANSLRREMASKKYPEERIARRIARYLDEAITETRQLARGLFPVRLERDGLAPALEELAKATRNRFKVRCHFTATGLLIGVPGTTATHLYRIAQEAVANAVKHSQSRNISICLRSREARLELKVTDDGRGLPVTRQEKAGLGLHIMDYRARTIGGSLRISRGRRAGTSVSCCVPCPPA